MNLICVAELYILPVHIWTTDLKLKIQEVFEPRAVIWIQACGSQFKGRI